MKLKGHKPGCRCVGCSAATRSRGMARLGMNPKRRRKVRKANPRRRAAPKKARARRVRRNPPYGPGSRGVNVSWSRKRNPESESTFIGRAPTLTVAGQGNLQFPRGMLHRGVDGYSVRLDLGGAPAPRPGSRVTRIEYDDPVKAVEAYKEIGRFRHDCDDPFVVGPAQGGSVLLTSKSIAWRSE